MVRTRLRGALVLLISTQAAARGRAAVAKALVRDVEAAAKSLPAPNSPSTPGAEIFTFAVPSILVVYVCALLYMYGVRPGHAARRNTLPRHAAL